jgi:hypothetical protein
MVARWGIRIAGSVVARPASPTHRNRLCPQADNPRTAESIPRGNPHLHRAGASERLDRALFAFNHSSDHVRAVRRVAARMRADERTLQTSYAWQVFVRAAGGGTRRITGPDR